jgi:hypothetical protein
MKRRDDGLCTNQTARHVRYPVAVEGKADVAQTDRHGSF